MALLGAEILLYPTAIGSEPEEAGAIDTSALWRRAMIGHAVSNSCYLAAANRVGTERDRRPRADLLRHELHQRIIRARSSPRRAVTDETVIVATLDLDGARSFRAGMGFFRDRRPDLYAPLLTADGTEGRLRHAPGAWSVAGLTVTARRQFRVERRIPGARALARRGD